MDDPLPSGTWGSPYISLRHTVKGQCWWSIQPGWQGGEGKGNVGSSIRGTCAQVNGGGGGVRETEVAWNGSFRFVFSNRRPSLRISPRLSLPHSTRSSSDTPEFFFFHFFPHVNFMMIGAASGPLPLCSAPPLTAVAIWNSRPCVKDEAWVLSDQHSISPNIRRGIFSNTVLLRREKSPYFRDLKNKHEDGDEFRLIILIFVEISRIIFKAFHFCLSIYRSTALCWTLATFSLSWSFYTVGRTPWTGDQPFARSPPAHNTAQTHPNLKWDSNPRSQCSRERRQFMP
jgi:hypothetical protein